MHEAQTPLFRFPEDSPYRNIFVKREDLSETGSHKFRYLKSQLEGLKHQGIHQVVLSTTGNAGITASHYAKQLGMKVFCLMSDRGDMDKAAQIEERDGFLVLSSRPVRFAKYLSKKYQVPFLRGSMDDFVVEQYRSLGEEIQQQVPEVAAIVNFGTSGTSTVGLMSAWKESWPALHLVQSGRSNSIVKALHPEQIPAITHEEPGLEDTPRREELLEYIRKSKGDAWY